MFNSWTAEQSVVSRLKRKLPPSEQEKIVIDSYEDDISMKSAVSSNNDWQSARLMDTLDTSIRVLIVGINPGEHSARALYPYAGRGNHFWPQQRESELVPFLGGVESKKCPRVPLSSLQVHGIGLCDLVARPSNSSSDLKASELTAGIPQLQSKIEQFQPNIVLLNAKCIYEALVRHAKTTSYYKQQTPPLLQHEVLDFIHTHPSPSISMQHLADHVELALENTRCRNFQFGVQTASILPAALRTNVVLLVTPCTSARVSGCQKKDKLQYFVLTKTLVDIARKVRPERKWHDPM